MSGLTSLVDTLLATRLAQRVDLVPLKPAVEVAGPGALTEVEEVTNDVRVPSRAAMLQQLGSGLLPDAQRDHGDSPARLGESVSLSPAARAVSAILDVQSGTTPKIIGTAALLPTAQLATPLLISATLAHTVANSGLFYESHLQQFAAGTRTLAQMAQEPQALLDVSQKTLVDRHGALPATQVFDSGGIGDGGDSAAGESAVLPRGATGALNKADVALIGSGKEAGGLSLSPRSEANSLAASYSTVDSSRPTGLHERAHSAIEGTDALDASGKSNVARGPEIANSNAPGLAGIHPDAVALVRQQLELLAVPVFRWAGEVRPGTPMDWEIHEEHEERPGAADQDGATQTWSTRLTLTLPNLKDVEVRIKLAGSILQVQLAAQDNATLALLNENGNELPTRLGEIGLQLAGLQIGKLEPKPSVPPASEANDGG